MARGRQHCPLETELCEIWRLPLRRFRAASDVAWLVDRQVASYGGTRVRQQRARRTSAAGTCEDLQPDPAPHRRRAIPPIGTGSGRETTAFRGYFERTTAAGARAAASAKETFPRRFRQVALGFDHRTGLLAGGPVSTSLDRVSEILVSARGVLLNAHATRTLKNIGGFRSSLPVPGSWRESTTRKVWSVAGSPYPRRERRSRWNERLTPRAVLRTYRV
jgi:hypothetical protein